MAEVGLASALDVATEVEEELPAVATLDEERVMRGEGAYGGRGLEEDEGAPRSR
jgi:hypothetical protein